MSSRTGRRRPGVSRTDSCQIRDDSTTAHIVHNPQLRHRRKAGPREDAEHRHNERALTWMSPSEARGPLAAGPRPGKKPIRLELIGSPDHPLISSVDRIMEQMKAAGTLASPRSPQRAKKRRERKRMPKPSRSEFRTTLDKTPAASTARVRKPVKGRAKNNESKPRESVLPSARRVTAAEVKGAASATDPKTAQLRESKKRLRRIQLKKRVWAQREKIRSAFEKYQGHQLTAPQLAANIKGLGIPVTQGFHDSLRAKEVRFARMFRSLGVPDPVAQSYFLPQDGKVTVLPESTPSIISYVKTQRTGGAEAKGDRASTEAAAKSEAKSPSVPAGISSGAVRSPMDTTRRQFESQAARPPRASQPAGKRRVDPKRPYQAPTATRLPARRARANGGRVIPAKLLQDFVKSRVSVDEMRSRCAALGIPLNDAQDAYLRRCDVGSGRKLREAKALFCSNKKVPAALVQKPGVHPGGFVEPEGRFSSGNIITWKGSKKLPTAVSRTRKLAQPRGPADKGEGKRRVRPDTDFTKGFNIVKNENNKSLVPLAPGRRRVPRLERKNRGGSVVGGLSKLVDGSAAPKPTPTAAPKPTPAAAPKPTPAAAPKPTPAAAPARKPVAASKPAGKPATAGRPAAAPAKKNPAAGQGRAKPRLRAPYGTTGDGGSMSRRVSDPAVRRLRGMKSGERFSRFSKDGTVVADWTRRPKAIMQRKD